MTSRLHVHLNADEDRHPEVDGKLLLDTGQSERGWHRLACAVQCPQKWAYKYHPKMVNDPRCQFPETDPLVRGTLMHVALAHYNRRLQAAQIGGFVEAFHDPFSAIELLAERMDSRPGRHPDSIPYAKYVDACKAAIRGYVDHYSGTDKWAILGVEVQYRALISCNGWSFGPEMKRWLFTQRADLIVRDARGKIVIVDYKTRGKKDSRAHRAYERDGQFSGYVLFGRNAYGKDFGGVLINYLTFGAKRTTFEREAVNLFPWRLRCFPDTIRWGERIQEMAESMQLDPWHYPKAMVGNGGCEHRYGPCEGAALCDYGPDAQPKKSADKWGLADGD